MGVHALSWAFSQELPCSQKMVLVGLADMVSIDGTCWPSQNFLAKKCGLSRSAVNQAMASLEETGHIVRLSRQRRDGSDTSCLYFLCMPLERIDGFPSNVPGHVYVLTDGTKTKIGITRNFDQRRRTLSKENGPLTTVLVVDCSIQQAARIESLALSTHSNTNVGGEWVSASPDEVAATVRRLFDAVVTHGPRPEGPNNGGKRRVAQNDTPLSPGATPPVAQDDTMNRNLTVKSSNEDLFPRPPSKKKSQPKTEIGTWEPGDTERDKAEAYWASKGRSDLNFEDERLGFLAHHRGNGSRMASWPDVWQTWYVRAPKMTRAPRPGDAPVRIPDQGQREIGMWVGRLVGFHFGTPADEFFDAVPVGFWKAAWGPKPGEKGCMVPDQAQRDFARAHPVRAVR